MKNCIIAALCLLIVAFSGCGSKKKITQIDSGIEYSNVNQNAVAKDSSKVLSTDAEKNTSSSSEDYNERIVETTTFDEKGNLKSYTKDTKRKGSKNSTNEESKNLSKDSTKVSLLAISVDSIGLEAHDEIRTSLDISSSNPIYKWIGAGLFVVIVIGAIYLYLKL